MLRDLGPVERAMRDWGEKLRGIARACGMSQASATVTNVRLMSWMLTLMPVASAMPSSAKRGSSRCPLALSAKKT